MLWNINWINICIFPQLIMIIIMKPQFSNNNNSNNNNDNDESNININLNLNCNSSINENNVNNGSYKQLQTERELEKKLSENESTLCNQSSPLLKPIANEVKYNSKNKDKYKCIERAASADHTRPLSLPNVSKTKRKVRMKNHGKKLCDRYRYCNCKHDDNWMSNSGTTNAHAASNTYHNLKDNTNTTRDDNGDKLNASITSINLPMCVWFSTFIL